MARYRKIEVGTWTDAKFRKLTPPKPNAQSLWFALLSGPRSTNIPGVVIAKPRHLAADLDWPEPAVKRFLSEIEAAHMAISDRVQGLIWLPNALRESNQPNGPNTVTSWRDVWSEVPECSLKGRIWSDLYAWTQAKGKNGKPIMGPALTRAFLDACPPPNDRGPGDGNRPLGTDNAQDGIPDDIDHGNADDIVDESRPPSGMASPIQDQEQKQKQDPPISPPTADRAAIPDAKQPPPDPPPPLELEPLTPRTKAQKANAEAERITAGLIEFLNRRADRAFTVAKPYVQLVKGLVEKGYTDRDIRLVIWHAAKRWKGNPEMEEFLQPSTLFRPKKFHERWDQARLAYGDTRPVKASPSSACGPPPPGADRDTKPEKISQPGAPDPVKGFALALLRGGSDGGR